MVRQTLSVAAAAAVLGAAVVNAQVAVWGQCGGQNYNGPTTCAAGSTCVFSNPYYSQCLPNSQVTSTTSTSARVTTSSTSTKPTTTVTGSQTSVSKTSTSTSSSVSSTATPPSDDPYTGYTVYLSPYYAAEVAAAVATIKDSTLANKAAQVAKIPTFTWFDVASKVPTLGTYLADAQSKQVGGTKYIVQIVIYDLPDRDCAALASNGEYSIANNGAANYKAYIDAIGAQISAYPDVRVVAVYEPDSLANLVTNLNVQKCANAQATYQSLAVYAWSTLTQPNLYIYVDAGHAGWLGWSSNIGPAAQLFGSLLKQAGSHTRIRGLATNVANFNALVASTPDPITQGDPNYDEQLYINALAPLLTQQGFPAHFIVDQGRSGVQNIRQQWGDWCNVNNAGFGTRPTTNTGSALIDAIVWVKPGGECDGTSNTSSPRYDAHCGLSDAKQPAPEAGSWFEAYFEMLVTNANPAFTVV